MSDFRWAYGFGDYALITAMIAEGVAMLGFLAALLVWVAVGCGA